MSKDPAPIDYEAVTKIQERAVQESLDILDISNVVLIEAPTGAGKTRINSRVIEEISKRLEAKGEDILALNLCHRENLAEQSKEAFHKWAPDCKIGTTLATDGNFDQSENNVYALVQTVAPRLDELRKYNVVGIDEAHHASDNKNGDHTEIINRILENNPEAKIIAVTATPSRPDGLGLAPILRDAPRVTIGWGELERAGQIILPQTVEVPITTENGTVNQVARKHYDPDKAANAAGLTKAIQKARPDDFLEQMANSWELKNDGRRTICYASSINQARAFHELMKERGHRVDIMDSAMSASHNKGALDRYAKGELDMVVSVKMIDEGVDVPATRCILILRETTSEIEYSQMVGRSVRAGDTAEIRATKPLVIDGGASTMIHGAIERRAAVIDYLQGLQRGEVNENIQAKPLVAGKEDPKIAGSVMGKEGYTPWRMLKTDPNVLGLTDGTGTILAVESRDAAGEPRYTVAEIVKERDKTRAKKLGEIATLRMMKNDQGKALFNIKASVLNDIATSRILPSRASLLRMEASPSKSDGQRTSLVDDRLAEVVDQKFVESVIAYQQQASRYNTR